MSVFLLSSLVCVWLHFFLLSVYLSISVHLYFRIEALLMAIQTFCFKFPLSTMFVYYLIKRKFCNLKNKQYFFATLNLFLFPTPCILLLEGLPNDQLLNHPLADLLTACSPSPVLCLNLYPPASEASREVADYQIPPQCLFFLDMYHFSKVCTNLFFSG